MVKLSGWVMEVVLFEIFGVADIKVVSLVLETEEIIEVALVVLCGVNDVTLLVLCGVNEVTLFGCTVE